MREKHVVPRVPLSIVVRKWFRDSKAPGLIPGSALLCPKFTVLSLRLFRDRQIGTNFDRGEESAPADRGFREDRILYMKLYSPETGRAKPLYMFFGVCMLQVPPSNSDKWWVQCGLKLVQIIIASHNN